MPRGGTGRGLAFAGVLGGIAGFRPDLAFVLNSVSRSRTADSLARLSGARLVVGRSRVYSGPLPADAPERPFESALDHVGRSRDRVYDLDLEPSRASEHQVDRYLDLVRWTVASTDRDVPASTDGRRALDRRASLATYGSRSMGRPVGTTSRQGDARNCGSSIASSRRPGSPRGAALWVSTPEGDRTRPAGVAGPRRGRPAALSRGPVDRFGRRLALDTRCNDSAAAHRPPSLAALSFTRSAGRSSGRAPSHGIALCARLRRAIHYETPGAALPCWAAERASRRVQTVVAETAGRP